jgi:hypothetical protein
MRTPFQKRVVELFRQGKSTMDMLEILSSDFGRKVSDAEAAKALDEALYAEWREAMENSKTIRRVR